MIDVAANDPEVPHLDLRRRIIMATVDLIAAGGRDAATTRAIAASASVQAPAIYRLFGDKRGLMDAVIEHGFSHYVAQKGVQDPHPDPLQDLSDGWDAHVAFCLANPGLFTVMTGDPHPRAPSYQAGEAVLRRRVHAVAKTSRLQMTEDRAVALLQSVAHGTVLTLLGQPAAHRDPGLLHVARDAVILAMVGPQAPDADMETAGVRGAAAGLRALLPGTKALSLGETHLMEELLDRIANG